MAGRFSANSSVYKKYLEQISTLYNNRADLQMYMEIILSLIAVIIFSLFAIRPTAVTITGLLAEIRAKRETIEQLDEKIDDLVAAETVLEQQRVQIATLNQAIPDEPLLEKQIRQIEGLSKRNSVGVVSLIIEDVVLKGKSARSKGVDPNDLPTQDSQFYPISLTAQGTYSEVTNFLSDLENLRRPIALRQASVIDSGNTGDDGVLYLSIFGFISYLEKNE